MLLRQARQRYVSGQVLPDDVALSLNAAGSVMSHEPSPVGARHRHCHPDPDLLSNFRGSLQYITIIGPRCGDRNVIDAVAFNVARPEILRPLSFSTRSLAWRSLIPLAYSKLLAES
jgi:hypothetical protein